MLQNSYRSQSMTLAQSVQGQFTNRVHRIDRGVKEAGFLVLVYSAMPSILIELGFISNPEEEKFLLSEQGQNYMASAIYRAFKNYKTSIEKGKDVELIEVSTEKAISEQKDSISKKEITETAYFGVQFTTSNKKKDLKSFNNIDDVWFYKQNSSYKYVSGKFSSFKKAKKQMNIIRKGDFKDAFIVSFVNNERSSRKETEDKINELQK